MKTTQLITLACTALMAFAQVAAAAPGDLDFSFGGNGKVTTSMGGSGCEAYSVALQGDGKIVVAGYSLNPAANYDFALARYNADGSLDTSFNGTGKVTTDFSSATLGTNDIGRGVMIQSDGKIVVAGFTLIAFDGTHFTNGFALARYNSDGSLDTTFNDTGKVTTAIGTRDSDATSIAVQSDGKIVVAGETSNGSNYDFALARYNADGTLDTTFNGTGKVTTSVGSGDDQASCLVVQSDGKIVVAGNSGSNQTAGTKDFAVVRYNANGSLDLTFNGTGKVTTPVGSSCDAANSVSLQSDGKIVVAGKTEQPSGSDIALVRYNTDGSLDSSFNGSGKVITDIAFNDAGNGVAVREDRKIVVVGVSGTKLDNSTSDFAVVRYNTNGSLDTTFNGTGKVITDISKGNDYANCVALQSDGKIVVAGVSKNAFALARYEGEIDTDGDGIPDRFETGTGIYVSPNDTGTSPTNPDSDGDGLSDGAEVNAYHSNPNIRDTDGDGFDDGFEVATGFSPTSAASSPDTYSTLVPSVEFRFGGANGISYRIESSTDLTNWSTIETNIIGTGGAITRFYSTQGQPKRFFRSRRN